MVDRVGKVLGDEDYDVLLTGPTLVSKLDSRPLCVYLPGVLTSLVNDPTTYAVLHSLRKIITRNRGLASGTPRYRSNQTRSYSRPTPSAVLGALDPGGQKRYCRLTAWTGRNLPEFETLQPLLQAIAGHFANEVPLRFAMQEARAKETDPAWVIPGTPFTTITVNNSYPTGTHKDSGDLDEGFSSIAVARRGIYTGGKLVFPQYRVAVDMQDGDLILMDAHEWHGNTQMRCVCQRSMVGYCELCEAERISVVSYFRTKLTECGSPDAELRRADDWHEHAEQAAAQRFNEGKAG
jgi:hypothetical protein